MAISLKSFIQKYTGLSANVPWSPEKNNGFQGECVSLIVRYLGECFDIPMDARGNAKDYSWSLVNAGLGHKVGIAKYGDILVYGTNVNPYGHIGVYLNEKEMFDQNNGGNRTAQIRSQLKELPIAIIRLNKGLIPDEVPADKTIDQLARETINGVYGNGDVRKKNLGSNYDAVQLRVNEILYGIKPNDKKPNEQIAKEVINGDWGNGKERKDKLTNAGYDYNVIQNLVNSML